MTHLNIKSKAEKSQRGPACAWRVAFQFNGHGGDPSHSSIDEMSHAIDGKPQIYHFRGWSPVLSGKVPGNSLPLGFQGKWTPSPKNKET